jgi:DNA polymerase III sliding clamp (beta) subunit (PCNA family)
VLNTIDHENIVMQLKSSEHSALIIHPEKSEIRYVIMPMRL